MGPKSRACGRRRALVALLAAIGCAGTARAVVFYSTADPAFNTNAPTGSLAGSGWQWVGTFGAYAATPISQNCFLAAHHIGGTVGTPIVYNGVSYPTVAYYDDTVSDLRVWVIGGSFPRWAPIYRGSNEVGMSLVVVGMGLGRGSPVMVNGTLAGWLWGSGGGALRWGTNTVREKINGGSSDPYLLYADFYEDANPASTVADLASGDSSGPLFINDGTGWTLAGVARAVSGPFSTNAGADGGFNASIFDARGLYYESSPGVWTLVPQSVPYPVNTGFYATEVSARAAWIDTITAANAPGDDTPALSLAATVTLVLALAGIGVWTLLRGPRMA